MTTGQKWLGLLLLQGVLIGGAYGGGYYQQVKQRRAAEDKAKAADEKVTLAQRALTSSRGRSLFLEAALAARYGNFPMAFERSVRGSSMAQQIGLHIEKEMEELTPLLVAQRPEAVDKLLRLADRVEAPPPPPNALPPDTTTKEPGVAAPRPATPAAAAPVLPSAPVAAPVPPAPSPSPGGAAPPAGAGSNLAEGRAALLGAKELLIAGGEPAQIVSKLAHAQVMLDEGGRSELGESITAAIKATRAHDETKARSAIDTALTQLRTP